MQKKGGLYVFLAIASCLLKPLHALLRSWNNMFNKIIAMTHSFSNWFVFIYVVYRNSSVNKNHIINEVASERNADLYKKTLDN